MANIAFPNGITLPCAQQVGDYLIINVEWRDFDGQPTPVAVLSICYGDDEANGDEEKTIVLTAAGASLLGELASRAAWALTDAATAKED